MKEFSEKELHENFILIHQFLYPDEAIKQWVLDQEAYNGNYHESWELLMEVVHKLSGVNKMSIVDLLAYLQQEHLGDDLKTPYHLYYVIVKELEECYSKNDYPVV